MPDILAKRRHLGGIPSELGHRSRRNRQDAGAVGVTRVLANLTRQFALSRKSALWWLDEWPGARRGTRARSVYPGGWPEGRAARDRGGCARGMRTGGRARGGRPRSGKKKRRPPPRSDGRRQVHALALPRFRAIGATALLTQLALSYFIF